MSNDRKLNLPNTVPQNLSTEDATSEIYARYIEDIEEWANPRHYTNKEVLALIDEYHKFGNINVRNDLVKSFIKYIVSLAAPYVRMGLSISDLINEGVLGLCIAIEHFDTSKEIKFVTYAHSVVSRYIREAIDYNLYIAKLPKNIRNNLKKAKMFVMKNEGTPEVKIPKEYRDFANNPLIYQKIFTENITNDKLELHLNHALETEDAQKVIDRRMEIQDIMYDVLEKDEILLLEYYFGIDREYPITSYSTLGKLFNKPSREIQGVITELLSKLKKYAEDRLIKLL